MESGVDKSLQIEADGSAIGAVLEAERVKQKLSREQVAHELNLRESMIRALEKDEEITDISHTYVRGYQRAYTRLLGINESEVLGDPPPAETVHRPQQNLHPIGKRLGPSHRRRAPGMWSKIAALIAVVAIAFFSWPKLSSIINLNGDQQSARTTSQSDIQVFQGEVAGDQDGAATTTVTGSENSDENLIPAGSAGDQVVKQPVPQSTGSGTINSEVISLANDLDQSRQLDNRNGDDNDSAADGQMESEPTLTQAATSGQSDQQTGTASVEQQDSPATITFVSNGESWLSISDADNNRLYRNILRLDRVSVTGMLPLYVSTGNVRVLRILVEQGEQQKVGIYNDSKTVAKFFVDLDSDGRLVFTPN